MTSLPETQIEDKVNRQTKAGFLDKLKIYKFKILGGILGILVFAGAVFAGYNFLRLREVKAAKIIKKSLEKILEKETIYHHKVSYYRLSLEPNHPESTFTTYEFWEDQDSNRFKQEVIYPNGKKVIQVFDGDILWDYSEEENTLRKDIYIYHDPKEKEIKHGERLDLIKTYRDLLDNGILKAYEGELEGRRIWQIIDERATINPSYWNKFYFDKETFMLLQQEKWIEREGKKVRTEKMTYEIMESIPKQNIDIAKIFLFDYPLSQDVKVFERHFDTSKGYVESDYYSAIPTQKPTVTKNFQPFSTPLTIEKIYYKPITSWQTYTDPQAKFSVQYPENYKLMEETLTYGKHVHFSSCFQHPKMGEICLSGYSINIYDDYDGGSRRAYFERKRPNFLTDPYYQDIFVTGIKALVIMDGNTGGSTGSTVLIPKGNKMYFFDFPFGWNPFTRDKSGLNFIKQVLSTFRFLE